MVVNTPPPQCIPSTAAENVDLTKNLVVQGRKNRRRKPRVCKNKEEVETQRMTRIAVEAKKAVPRDDQNIINRKMRGISGSPDPGSMKKIFVGGLASSVTESDFKNYFDHFGTITDVVVMFNTPIGYGVGSGRNYSNSSTATRDIWGNGGLSNATNASSRGSFLGTGTGSLGPLRNSGANWTVPPPVQSGSNASGYTGGTVDYGSDDDNCGLGAVGYGRNGGIGAAPTSSFSVPTGLF
ncbi:RNA-binding family protein isoform 2 [Hibiscus syriacus]|uniref:RNA-binding family protein isoform 2 n=1 Tax=Hibiscus syriacus TaxID=106335 RepID=A0A6A3A4L4_HIBSY|nr:RNA-binding family protein isoform 2 [Hibiscus syriacus]